MKLNKLNLNWKASEAQPDVEVVMSDSKLLLTFEMDAKVFSHVDSGDKATLSFNDAFAYRVQSCGFAFRYNLRDFNTGDFYELRNTEPNTNFPGDKIVVNEELQKAKLNHYLLLYGDSIFECLAKGFQLIYHDGIEEILEEKYPKGYLNHYIAMFASQFDKPNKDNFIVFTDLYIQMEGRKEFASLKSEIGKIKSLKDEMLYVKFANHYPLAGFELKQLQEMFQAIEGFSR